MLLPEGSCALELWWLVLAVSFHAVDPSFSSGSFVFNNVC
jgi:hypothetical protein